jgi:hypothetical protein
MFFLSVFPERFYNWYFNLCAVSHFPLYGFIKVFWLLHFFLFSFDCARYNKDNYILAVDSVGHTSLPVLVCKGPRFVYNENNSIKKNVVVFILMQTLLSFFIIFYLVQRDEQLRIYSWPRIRPKSKFTFFWNAILHPTTPQAVFLAWLTPRITHCTSPITHHAPLPCIMHQHTPLTNPATPRNISHC